jgi:hypothetical protein
MLMSTPPATSSGLDWPFSQRTKLREKKLAASAVREVTSMSSGATSQVQLALSDTPAARGSIFFWSM